MEEKKTLFSGIQPTGIVTLGNYIGALRNWVKLQDEYRCVFSVVNMHAITVQQEPAVLRKNTLELLALYIAAGIDPEKNIMFVQSHVPAHAELCWVLNTLTYVGEAMRMTQFKDKSRKHAENVNMGLMDYPILMAADILLYQTDIVPVGVDQKQHLELARDLAERFNNRYSPTFRVPEGYIPQEGAKIMSLSDPTAKMSKSDENENGFIALSDTPEVIARKFKRAVTDSDGEIRAGADKPGVTNLLTIFACLTGKTVAEAESAFRGAGYGELKQCVADCVIEALAPIQQRQKELVADKAALDAILRVGAEKARHLASRTMDKVYRKIGFYQVP